jgi:PAS domain S-box-containing protein
MTERLQVLVEAMNAFAAAADDPQHLLETITRRTSEAMDAYCGFTLVSDDGATLETVALHDPDPAACRFLQQIAGPPMAVDAPHLLAATVRTGEGKRIEPITDAMLRSRYPRAEDYDAAVALALKSVVFVPLRARGKTLGAFTLARHGDGAPPFDDVDLQLARGLADHAALAIANARLFGGMRDQLAARERLEGRLRTMAALARELTAVSSDYQRLIDLFTQRMGELIGEGCTLRLVSKNQQWVESSSSVFHTDPAKAREISAAMLEWPLRVGEGFVGRVVASGTPLMIPRIDPAEAAAQAAEAQRAFIGRLAIRSVMVVPLLSRGQVIGVASLIRSQPDRPYTEEDFALFQEGCGQVTLAIANARLFAEAQAELAERQRLADRLRLLSELSREFAANTGDVGALLRLVARRVAEVLRDGCSIRMLSEDGQELESPGVMYNEDVEELRHLEAVMRLQPQRVGEGASGRVAATGETLLIPVVDTGAMTASADERSALHVQRFGMRSILIVALRSNDKVTGVLAAYRTRTETPFTEDDRRLLEDVAAHASLAITNSERLRTQEVLRRGFLEAAPDAVLIVNPAGLIQLVNSQTETLFGYERSELIGQPIEVLVPTRLRDRHPGHRAGYLPTAATRPMGAGLNLFAVRKDGSEFAAEISLSPIHTPEGTLVAAAVRDVTERRREMEERNRRMQEANRLKSEFLANMSHELRTPLNAVIGFAALMHSGKAGPMAPVHTEYIGDILNSSRHLLQLINDVLDLSKVEAGRMEMRVEATDVPRTVSEVRDIVRGLAAERHVRVTIELDAGVTEVQVDPRMLKQVLYNYLSNAIKFTPDGGRVTLRITPEPDDAFRIDVEDNGIGIKPEDMVRLFVEFQQLDQGSAKRYPGTGLGLALTKRIVEAQGGRVGVRSMLGQGSTFSAILPRKVEVRNGG